MRQPTSIRVFALLSLALLGAARLFAQDTTPPQILGLDPWLPGSGWTQKFTFWYADADGGSNLVSAQMSFGNTLSPSNSCWVYVGLGWSEIFLADDAGNLQGPLIAGTSGALQNSRCVVYAAGSSVQPSGAQGTNVSLNMSFKTAYAGSRQIWSSVWDGTFSTEWIQLGSWTATVPPAPSLSIVSSHVGPFTQGQTGAAYTLTAINSSTAGPTDGSTVTVTETLPAGLTLVSMSGTGWSCSSKFLHARRYRW